MASLIGAYFIASLAFTGHLKSSVTQPKLIGFTSTFVLSFVLIYFIIALILSRNVSFGR